MGRGVGRFKVGVLVMMVLMMVMGVRMGMAQSETQREVDSQTHDTEQKHSGSIDELRMEEPFHSHDDEHDGERPYKEDGNESAEDLCACEAEGEVFIGGEPGKRDCEKGDGEAGEIGEKVGGVGHDG